MVSQLFQTILELAQKMSQFKLTRNSDLSLSNTYTIGTGANQDTIFQILRSANIDWQTSLVGQKPRLCDVMLRWRQTANCYSRLYSMQVMELCPVLCELTLLYFGLFENIAFKPWYLLSWYFYSDCVIWNKAQWLY